MRHIIDAIAAQGRDGDTELLHVTKGELAGLDGLSRHVFGRDLPRNPRTGIKEASLFQDWFGQDVGTALGVIAPIALGFIPGVGIPAAIAAGAAMGAANQGLGKGGTTQGALLGGVMGGIAGYGGAGIAESLASAGSAATQSTLEATAANLANPATEVAATTTPAVTTPGAATTAEFAPLGGDTAAATTIAPPAPEVAGPAFNPPNAIDKLNPNLGTQFGQDMTKAGLTFDQQAARFAELNKTAAGLPQPGSGAEMWSGAKSVVSSPQAFGSFVKDNASTALKAGIGGYGSAVNMAQPAPIAIPGQEPETNYEGELYYGPNGEIRSRAVKAAQGGMMFGDYDAADAEDDGGYAPGGLASMAAGGDVKSSSKGDFGVKDLGTYMKLGENRAALSPEEAKAARTMLMAKYLGPSRTQQNYVNGGIASMAQGRYLQGPGDGMSDSIKADIDGHQPARLATGEFVVPADVVSGLGNGDSTSGAKQLHSMMDRVRMARTGTKKQGKQINPRKQMPV